MTGKNAKLAELPEAVLRRFRAAIGRPSEMVVHRFLVKWPILLPLWYPLDNVVLTKFRLGEKFVADFAFAREDSHGIRWHLIEIEQPSDTLFTKAGELTKWVHHGLRQLHDWHDWFTTSLDYIRRNFPFARQMAKHGLLTEPHMTLIIGRRATIAPERRLLLERTPPGVRIMTYDRLCTEWFGAFNPDKPLRVCKFGSRGLEVVSELTMRVTAEFTHGP